MEPLNWSVRGTLLVFLGMVLVFSLTAGAIIISWIVGEWVTEQTSNETLGLVTGFVLVFCFVVNLALQIGVVNFLRHLRKTPQNRLPPDLRAWLYPNE